MSAPGGRAGAGGFLDRFVLGANYWSRAGGPRMWDVFDEAQVRAELAQAKAIGLDCLRAFAFVPSFMPRPPAVDDGARGRLRRFYALAAEAGVGLLQSALVGHMSGENFHFPGQGGRSLWSDPELRVWQRALVQAVAEDAREAEAVWAFVLSNEMPLWAGGGSAEAIADWARDLVGVTRAADPRGRPVSVGDGMTPTFPTGAIASTVDWLGPHVYYGDADPLRQAYQTDLRMRAAQAYGRPVVLEEFGCSSTQAGDAEQAAYLREGIFAALGCGAKGAIAWCFSDFDPEIVGRVPPYSHHGFELGFGLTRADGREKPVCDELRAARQLLDGLGPAAAPRPKVAIVRPSYLAEDFPFSWQDRELMHRTLLQGFVLASQAGLDPAVVGEGDDLSPYALILCPATQKLTVPTWLALRNRARDGATVYWSYFSGDHRFHQGMWCPIFEELTGLRHRLRYGCFDLPGERCVLRAPLQLSVPTGVAHAQAPYPLARLPVELQDGAPVRVLATDGEGRPALTAHDLGAGQVVFLAYPLERYLAQLPDGSARDGHRLYRLLADEAGLAPRYATRHPDVQSRVLGGHVIVQHRGWTDAVDDATDVPREATVEFERGIVKGGALGPKAVRVYRLPPGA